MQVIYCRLLALDVLNLKSVFILAWTELSYASILRKVVTEHHDICLVLASVNIILYRKTKTNQEIGHEKCFFFLKPWDDTLRVNVIVQQQNNISCP